MKCTWFMGYLPAEGGSSFQGRGRQTDHKWAGSQAWYLLIQMICDMIFFLCWSFPDTRNILGPISLGICAPYIPGSRASRYPEPLRERLSLHRASDLLLVQWPLLLSLSPEHSQSVVLHSPSRAFLAADSLRWNHPVTNPCLEDPTFQALLPENIYK